MLQRIKRILFKYRNRRLLDINDTLAQQMWLEGHNTIPSEQRLIHEHGFKCFSQHEEDGILLHIFSLIGAKSKLCIEMCCGTGMECNAANLIVNHFWTGVLFDGSKENIDVAQQFFKFHPNTTIYPPSLVHAWITKDNVDQLLVDQGVEGEVDLFSLDLDGIDYYVWQQLSAISPRVVVLEFNHLLGPEASLSVPYADDFCADFTADGSDYAGASLQAFIGLAKRKGYYLVGTNRFATNAFFIRDDIRHPDLPEVTDVQEYFTHPRAKFGMTVRYQRVKDKHWVEVQ